MEDIVLLETQVANPELSSEKYFSVHDHITDDRVTDHWIPVCKDDVGILSDFQTAYTVFHSNMLCRIDGDGLQRQERIHTGFDGQTGTKRQVLLRNDRGVSDDGNLQTGGSQNPGGRP